MYRCYRCQCPYYLHINVLSQGEGGYRFVLQTLPANTIFLKIVQIVGSGTLHRQYSRFSSVAQPYQGLDEAALRANMGGVAPAELADD